MGSGGPVGLNFLAVERMALRAGVPKEEILDFFTVIDDMAVKVIDFQMAEFKARQEAERRNNK